MPHVNFQLRTNILDHELEVPAEIPRGSNQVQKKCIHTTGRIIRNNSNISFSFSNFVILFNKCGILPLLYYFFCTSIIHITLPSQSSSLTIIRIFIIKVGDEYHPCKLRVVFSELERHIDFSITIVGLVYRNSQG